MQKKLNVIVTGASGMVGEGVVLECLNNESINNVLVIGRRKSGIEHPMLKEILINDFTDLSTVSDLNEYNACFFCLGTTSLKKTDEEYFRTTYTLTLGFAQELLKVNRDITFCYVSGSGTDSTEQGKLKWARVKGKTENDLSKLPFKSVYHFRPGFMKATVGQKNLLPMYKYVNPLYPIFKLILPNHSSTLQELAKAMINSAKYGYEKNILEVKDIKKLANAK